MLVVSTHEFLTRLVLNEGLKSNTGITELNLSSCNLTDKSGIKIASLFKVSKILVDKKQHHKARRESELWKQTLREGESNCVDQELLGLQKINLSGNRLDNKTGVAFGDALKSDPFILGIYSKIYHN